MLLQISVFYGDTINVILTATAISAGCHENRSENINKNNINICLTVHCDCTRTVDTNGLVKSKTTKY